MARHVAPTNQWREPNALKVAAPAGRLYPAQGSGQQWGWTTIASEAEGVVGTGGGQHLGVDESATVGGASVFRFADSQMVALEES